MRNPMAAIAGAFLVLVAHQASAAPAPGDPPENRAQAPVDSVRAKSSFVAGSQYLDQGDYADAVVALRAACAYDLRPQYAYELAMAERLNGDCLAARDDYRVYAIMIGPAPPDPETELKLENAFAWIADPWTDCGPASAPTTGGAAPPLQSLATAEPLATTLSGALLALSQAEPVPASAVVAGGLQADATLPRSCGQSTPDAIQQAGELAIGWIRNNQRPDGTYVYQYDSASDSEQSGYNAVRHAGVTWALFIDAGRTGDANKLAAADQALAWMLSHVTTRHGWTALVSPGEDMLDLGGTDLLVVSLAQRRLVTGDPRYDDEMRSLGRFIVALQTYQGGFFDGFDQSADAIHPTQDGLYTPGESLFALTLLHQAFPSDGFDQHAHAALNFLSSSRGNNQWAAYAIAEMAGWGGLTDDNVTYAQYLAARYEAEVTNESERLGSWYGRLALGSFARGAAAGTWMEALAALWRASQKDDRLAGLAGPTKESGLCLAGIMAERQVSPSEAGAFESPKKAEGAWFFEGETRVDDMQHSYDGLVYLQDAAAGIDDRNGPPSVGEPGAAPASAPVNH
jgi:hypothetical protein